MAQKDQILYRDLREYKYQLVEDYAIQTAIRPQEDIIEPATGKAYISLSKSGLLKIRADYAWDGASGPVFDTPENMRGSLVHDALYQLMRTKRLNYKKHRDAADKLLKILCIDDGTDDDYARLMYFGVRIGGEAYARPQPENSYTVYLAPK